MSIIPNLSGGAGGIKGASSSSDQKLSFNRKGGNITFGNKGIDQRYVLAGAVVAVVAVTFLLMRKG